MAGGSTFYVLGNVDTEGMFAQHKNDANVTSYSGMPVQLQLVPMVKYGPGFWRTTGISFSIA